MRRPALLYALAASLLLAARSAPLRAATPPGDPPARPVRPVRPVRIDFELDAGGAPLPNGLPLDGSREIDGLVRVHGEGGGHFGAALFDSDPLGPNMAGPDPDLLVDQGNLVVLQGTEGQTRGLFDVPSSADGGGTLVLEFSQIVEPIAIDLVDIEAGVPPQDVTLKLVDTLGRTRHYFVPGGWTEDIVTGGTVGVTTLSLTTLAPQDGASATATAAQHPGFAAQRVVRMEAKFAGSGALDGLTVVPVTLDDPQVLLEVPGTSGESYFGSALARVGDLDADGVEDVVVGTPNSSPSLPERIRVLSGRTGATLLQIDGPVPDVDFGVTVDGVGDVDGDAVPDLVVGSPKDHSTSYWGRVSVHSGATGGAIWTRTGAPSWIGFAEAVARVDDLDGDGIDDVAVAAEEQTGEPSIPHSGVVHFYSGVDGSPLFDAIGFEGDEGFGSSVSAAGDVDGDGQGDIAIGGTGAGPSAGSLTVLSGASGEVIFRVTGQSGDYLGGAVAAAGDIDGDGYGDVICGAPAAHLTGYFQSGFARVYHGPDGREGFTFPGFATYWRVGQAVAGGGDMDGDGVPDLVVGAPGQGVGLAESGAVHVFSGATGDRLFVVFGAHYGDRLGTAVADAGDPSRDGFAEVWIGAPFADVSTGLVQLVTLGGPTTFEPPGGRGTAGRDPLGGPPRSSGVLTFGR